MDTWDLECVKENPGAYRAYVENLGGGSFCRESFGEAWSGAWDSEQDFAEQLADDLGLVPEGSAAFYFDYEAFARDLFMGDYFSVPAPGGQVYVFRSL